MRFTFKEFVVDSSLFMLTKNGQKVELEPRIFELLLYFCRHPNAAISREELIEQVWQQRIVSYAAINRAVSELRKVLEQDLATPEIIATISKVGYQFTITPTIQAQASDEPNSTRDGITENTENTQTLSPSVEGKSTNVLTTKVLSQKIPASLVLILVITIAVIFTLTQLFSSPQATVPVSVDTVEQPLTSLKGIATKAILSKHGNDLLFLHRKSPSDNAMIWLQTNDDSPQPLTNDNFYYMFATFGADNQIIASRFNNLHQRQCEIVSINIRTRTISPMLDCAERASTFLAFNASSNTLYFNYRTQLNAPYSIYAYQVATDRLQQITFPYSSGNIRGDYMFSLSPAQDKLAILEYQENSSSALKILDLPTNDITYHQRAFSTSSSISWLNDKQLIVSDDKGLHSYDLSKKQLRTLKAQPDIGFSATDPYSNTVVFNKGITIANLYQYPISGSNNSRPAQAITDSNFINYQPKFANLSNKIAFLTTDNGDTEIMVKPENANAFNTNFNDKIKSLANFHWSPDDNSLVASINNQLHIFNQQTKQWRLLLTEQHNVHFVHYANQDQILFSSDISGDWQIWQLTINNGQLSQVTKNGGYSVQGNPKDEYLYLTKFNNLGLYRLNLSTKEQQPVIADFPRTSWNKWQLIADTVYYISEKHIIALDTKHMTSQPVLAHGERAPASFSVSYDEKYLQREIIEQSNSNIWSIKVR